MKIYVGNLPLSYDEENIKTLFEGFELTSVKVILDRDTGKSRGFAFVEIDSKTDAQRAIKELNGKEVENRSIVVNEARPRVERKRFSSYNPRFR